MITQTTDIDGGTLQKLKSSHYSRRIRSHFLAYGTKYDFCRFFLIKDDNEQRGVISLFNSAMVVSAFENKSLTDSDISELSIFINMTKPFTVELDFRYAEILYPHIEKDYNSYGRVEFEFRCPCKLSESNINETPRLDDVFDILKTSFPAIKQTKDLWLTDTSHRVRRKMSQCITLDNVSTATVQYLIDGTAFIGHVATLPSHRGKHLARELLYSIGERLNKEGFKVRLYARDYNVGYYSEIGFKQVNRDKIFECKNTD